MDAEQQPSSVPSSGRHRETVWFGPFRFDPASGFLYCDGEELSLPPKALGVLECLLEEPGTMVSKQTLVDAVWDDAYVTDRSLNEAVRILRHALGDDSHRPTYIQTVHRRGYRFIAPVTTDSETLALVPGGQLRLPVVLKKVLVVASPIVRRWGQPMLWGLAGLAVGLLAGAFIVSTRWRPTPAPPPLTQAVITLPSDALLGPTRLPWLALSPDGMYLAYTAVRGGDSRLYLRAMDQREAIPIPGTEGARLPFFSHNGQWVGFHADGRMKKVPVRGGDPVVICEVGGYVFRGATWRSDDTIIFTPQYGGGLAKVSAAGGTPQMLTSLDSTQGEYGHYWPEILPGGKAVVFTIWPGFGFAGARIAVLSLETGEIRTLIRGAAYARYAPTGHLVYARPGELMAVPFDADSLEVTGAPVSILEGVATNPTNGAVQFALSGSGTLAYVPGGLLTDQATLVQVDRAGGGAQPLIDMPEAFSGSLDVSPDGQRLAFTLIGDNWDIWVLEMARGTMTRLTFEGENIWPVWSPDGEWLAFSSTREGIWNLYRMPADGSGPAERLVESEFPQYPTSWSPDGRMLAFYQREHGTDLDVWILPLEDGRKPRPFARSPFRESGARFSPDGRWIAYVSSESGWTEVYVRPYPGPGGKWQVSRGGGVEPRWSADGRELFYLVFGTGRVMVAAVTTEPGFSVGPPRVLFEGPYGDAFGVAIDGQRFLLLEEVETPAPSQLNVVFNWFEDLERRAPAGQ